MSPDDYSDLWNRARNAKDVAEGMQFLARIKELTNSSELDSHRAFSLNFAVFDALKTLTRRDPDQAVTVIRDSMLPNALIEATGKDDTFHPYHYREKIRDWINEYGEPEKSRVRDELLRTVCSGIAAEPTKSKCWLIATIGYRSELAEESLAPLLSRDDEVGDAALSAIVGLGIPVDRRSAVIQEVKRRSLTRPPKSILYALQELADESFLETIIGMAKDEKNTAPEVEMSVMPLLSQLAEKRPEDLGLQDKVWSAISEIMSVTTKFRDKLELDSRVAAGCNSTRVVPELLRSLSGISQSSNRRYMVYERLLACTRPQHLEGWDNPQNLSALSVLREDACADTGNESRSMTFEMMNKDKAWEIALCLGSDKPLEWFGDAVASETSHFSREKVMRLRACFPCQNLPDFVLNLITEPRNFERKDGGADYFSRAAAIDLARCGASFQAFEALLNFGMTFDGHTPLSTVEALSEVSASLIKSGQTHIVSRLVDTANPGHKLHHRTAAVSVLRDLAIQQLIQPSALMGLLPLVEDDELPVYSKARILEAIGFSDDTGVVNQSYETLRRFGLGQAQDEVTWRSLETLARHKTWTRTENAFAQRLGLVRDQNLWRTAEPASLNGSQSFIICILYHQVPSQFTEAVRSLLRNAPSDAVYQALRYLLWAVARDSSLKEPILDAFVDCVRLRQTATSTEPYLIESLGLLSPERLASEQWEDDWVKWLPDTRVALADALGRVSYENGESSKRAIELLRKLMGDGTFAVRRSSYRALSVLKQEALDSTCKAWAAMEDSEERRKRAAEAIGWSCANPSELTHHPAYGLLVSDREPSVREAIARSESEARARYWADMYLERLLQYGSTTPETLLAFKYGQALSSLGDDGHSKRLRERTSTGDNAPHLRHWYRRITKSIDDRWKDEVRKWPDPWLSFEGRGEEVNGRVEYDDGKSFDAHFSLWKGHSTGPSRHVPWGGAFSLVNSTVHFQNALVAVTIKIEGRQPARADVFRVEYGEGGVNLFNGNGSYPEKNPRVQ
jgi:HEAT repeat protein